jgi:hypothetical protein
MNEHDFQTDDTIERRRLRGQLLAGIMAMIRAGRVEECEAAIRYVLHATRENPDVLIDADFIAGGLAAAASARRARSN